MLTLLADGSSLAAEVIAERVSQPLRALLETGEWLQVKGLIRVEDEGFVLTERGAEVASQLLDMAIEHERQTLACLSESQQLALKDSLKSLFEALR